VVHHKVQDTGVLLPPPLHPLPSSPGLPCTLPWCQPWVPGSTQPYLHHSSFFHCSRLNSDREFIATAEGAWDRRLSQQYTADRSRQKPCFIADRLPEKGRRACEGKVLRVRTGERPMPQPSAQQVSCFVPLGSSRHGVCSDHTTPEQTRSSPDPVAQCLARGGTARGPCSSTPRRLATQARTEPIRSQPGTNHTTRPRESQPG